MANGVSVATPEAMPHISDDSFDHYAMGRLAESDMSVVEEHLLICQECQDRMKATDTYLKAMRSAMKKQNTVVKSKSSRSKHRVPIC